jgi:hypothetical protein
VTSLLSIFPNPDDLLALEPEDLGGVLLEVVPGVMQNHMFGMGDVTTALFPSIGGGYPPGLQRPVRLGRVD